MEPSPAERAVIKAVRRAKLFVFLREHRHEPFDGQFQAELAEAYADSPRASRGRFLKTQFSIAFGSRQLTCPAGVSIGFRPGKTVRFPAATCAACPLRARCTSRPSGHSVGIYPDEAPLAELRER